MPDARPGNSFASEPQLARDCGAIRPAGQRCSVISFLFDATWPVPFSETMPTDLAKSMELRHDPELERAMRRLRFWPRLKRSLRKRYIRLVHGDDFFVTEYFGARFIVRWADMVAREIALKNFEHVQLDHFIRACVRLKPDVFIDIGANLGLYSCILLRRELVPHAILFEPDRHTASFLRANLEINNVLDKADCRDAAVGSKPGRLRLIPGPETNRGMSRIVESEFAKGYEVEMIRFDDVFAFSGQTLAIKLDIEGYELNALEGMKQTLLENSGIVQVECTKTRAQVIEAMREFGYLLVADFHWDLLFEKS